MTKVIPRNAFLYKEGLYIVESVVPLGNMTRTKWELYAADGWSFYDLQSEENYDGDGNLLPLEDRIYAQYMIMTKDEAYVANNIVPITAVK